MRPGGDFRPSEYALRAELKEANSVDVRRGAKRDESMRSVAHRGEGGDTRP